MELYSMVSGGSCFHFSLYSTFFFNCRDFITYNLGFPKTWTELWYKVPYGISYQLHHFYLLFRGQKQLKKWPWWNWVHVTLTLTLYSTENPGPCLSLHTILSGSVHLLLTVFFHFVHLKHTSVHACDGYIIARFEGQVFLQRQVCLHKSIITTSKIVCQTELMLRR